MGVGALTDDFRMLSMESWSQGEPGRAGESHGEAWTCWSAKVDRESEKSGMSLAN